MERSHHRHHAGINESTDGIGIWITRVEEAEEESSNRACRNQADGSMAPQVL